MDGISLVKEAKGGNRNALLELIMNKKDDYYRLALVYMKNNEDALDVMQDMTLILYQNIRKLKDDGAFYSWSKTILVNCCKKQLKKKRKVIFFEDNEEMIYEENFEKMEDTIILEKGLSKLNFKYQEVIKLRYYLDMDYESIADLINIPVGTVKSRLSNGLKKLSINIGGEWK